MYRISRLGAVVLGHFTTDCYMGMVLPLLPIIRDRLDLSLAQVMFVPVCTSVTASLAQPLFGLLSDRTRRSYLIGFGVAITGVGICTFGTANSFPAMMVFLGIGGLGCGAFHPAGAALVSAAGGERRDLALGIFSPGGIVGYSLGPIIGMWLYHQRGIDNMWPGMIFGLVAGPVIGALAFGLEGRKGERPPQPPEPVDANGALMSRRSRLTALAVLTSVVFLRSALIIAFASSLALFLEHRGVPEGSWGRILMVFLLAGGIAGILGGHFAPVIGRRRLTIITLAFAGPALLGFIHTSGLPSWVMLVVGGALAQATVPVNIVQAQLLLPRHQSLASALMMGFCWGIASFLTPVFGHIADISSLTVSLSIVCVIPMIGAILAFFVPDFNGRVEGQPGPELPPLPPLPPPQLVDSGGG